LDHVDAIGVVHCDIEIDAVANELAVNEHGDVFANVPLLAAPALRHYVFDEQRSIERVA
jgi:hypothetical protein